jgi:hypothetical protein
MSEPIADDDEFLRTFARAMPPLSSGDVPRQARRNLTWAEIRDHAKILREAAEAECPKPHDNNK